MYSLQARYEQARYEQLTARAFESRMATSRRQTRVRGGRHETPSSAAALGYAACHNRHHHELR
jgi:hypothetical protein